MLRIFCQQSTVQHVANMIQIRDFIPVLVPKCSQTQTQAKKSHKKPALCSNEKLDQEDKTHTILLCDCWCLQRFGLPKHASPVQCSGFQGQASRNRRVHPLKDHRWWSRTISRPSRTGGGGWWSGWDKHETNRTKHWNKLNANNTGLAPPDAMFFFFATTANTNEHCSF